MRYLFIRSHGRIKIIDAPVVPTKLAITAPMNNFPLRDNAARVILIAGGIGVTPVLSMVRQLQKTAADWQLHYCARGPERI